MLEILGKKLKLVRESRGHTQEAVAARAGISAQTLRKAENGGTATLDLLRGVVKAINDLDRGIPDNSSLQRLDVQFFVPRDAMSDLHLGNAEGKDVAIGSRIPYRRNGFF